MGDVVDIRSYRKQEAERMTKLEFEARVEFLEGYISNKHKMQNFDMLLQELELDYGPGARSLSGMPSGGKKGDGSDRIIRRMEDKKAFAAKYSKHRSEAMKAMDSIEAVVCELSPKHQQALRCRFFEDMDIHQIASKLNYSYRQVQRHIQQGVERIRPPRHTINKIKARLLEEHPEWALIEMKSA